VVRTLGAACTGRVGYSDSASEAACSGGAQKWERGAGDSGIQSNGPQRITWEQALLVQIQTRCAGAAVWSRRCVFPAADPTRLRLLGLSPYPRRPAVSSGNHEGTRGGLFMALERPNAARQRGEPQMHPVRLRYGGPLLGRRPP
jgi:hypothetical protein